MSKTTLVHRHSRSTHPVPRIPAPVQLRPVIQPMENLLSDISTDYTTSFVVERTPAEAFAAVVDPRSWWSSTINGRADEVGEVFNHAHEDVHRCSMQVTELIPGRRVVWHVVENYFSFTEDSTEWTGTDLVFDIVENGAGCRVTFTHVGLLPQLECYDLCERAWKGAVLGTLRRMLAVHAQVAS